jgi:menaquinone-dependent protoporphyrinogen IX oxidase
MLQTNPKGFDGVFIGSIHMHKYQSAMAHYITDHLAILSQIPEHFSPFPVAWDGRRTSGSSKITDKFLKKKGGSHC